MNIITSDNISNDTEQVIGAQDYDKLFILTDKNTATLCLPLLSERLRRQAKNITIPAGEQNKSLNSLKGIWMELANNGATRHSLLINLGGGMITDIGGFAASTFKRGINFINIPTTLLGAVDASVGGKTGINFAGYKNEIGVFRNACAIIISDTFFHTIPQQELLSGYAEMLKHALIYSNDELQKLLSFPIKKDILPGLNNLVLNSIKIKQSFVERDPQEQGIRRALNFGHTAGHAFEALSLQKGKPLPHGFAIAYGMIVELYLSHKLCGFPKNELRTITNFITEHYGIYYIECKDYDTLYEIMQQDKKNRSDQINFTLLSDIGKIRLDQHPDKEAIFEAFDLLLN